MRPAELTGDRRARPPAQCRRARSRCAARPCGPAGTAAPAAWPSGHETDGTHRSCVAGEHHLTGVTRRPPRPRARNRPGERARHYRRAVQPEDGPGQRHGVDSRPPAPSCGCTASARATGTLLSFWSSTTSRSSSRGPRRMNETRRHRWGCEPSSPPPGWRRRAAGGRRPRRRPVPAVLGADPPVERPTPAVDGDPARGPTRPSTPESRLPTVVQVSVQASKGRRGGGQTDDRRERDRRRTCAI